MQKASLEGIAHFQYVFSRADHPYTLIYRTQRIIFDCLSDNVDKIAGSGKAAASVADIEARFIETERRQCTNWVTNQMVGVDGGARPQIPLPLRVIWTAGGPKETRACMGAPRTRAERAAVPPYALAHSRAAADAFLSYLLVMSTRFGLLDEEL